MIELEKSTVYFRDHLMALNEANLSIASAPMLYGLSIYTVFPVMWNQEKNELNIFRLEDHFRRLQNSAKIMDFGDFESDWNYKKFSETMVELLNQNNVKEDVLVRVVVFIDEILSGTKMRGLKQSLTAFIYPYHPLFSSDGISLCVSSWQRTPDNSIPSRAKVNGSYVNSSLIKNEALINGYDDAVSLDNDGHVVESSVANIFIVRDGTLITPGGSADLLEGLTRDTLFKIAKGLGIDSTERSIDRSELYLADEIFLCGSSVRITPVFSVDRHTISQQAGQITNKLSDAYNSAIYGLDSKYDSWLKKIKPQNA